MDIGSRIDMLYALRANRLDLERNVKDLKQQETMLREIILADLDAAKLQGARGSIATTSITEKIKANVTDWELVYEFIREQDMPELLQKRITEGLWAALQEDGTLVPGTEPFVVRDLSLTKASKS